MRVSSKGETRENEIEREKQKFMVCGWFYPALYFFLSLSLSLSLSLLPHSFSFLTGMNLDGRWRIIDGELERKTERTRVRERHTLKTERRWRAAARVRVSSKGRM